MTRRIFPLASALGLALALVLTLPTAAAAAPVSPAPTAAPTAAPGPRPTPTATPGPSAAELNAQVQRQTSLLAAQEGRLSRATAEANQALERYQEAGREAERAARQAAEQSRRLAAAQQVTKQARERLAGYVGSLYRTGMVGRDLTVYASLLSAKTPRQMFKGLGLAQRVGGNQNNAMVALAEAEAAQAVVAARAAQTQRVQQEAQLRAAAAKDRADRLVEAASLRVMDQEIRLLRTQAAAAAASALEQRRASLLARAERIARERALAPNPAIDGARVPRPQAECKGRSTEGYENGRIPPEVLCPLWGTRGQMLRADAAAAFNDMSKAYAQEFGAPICVTDSYRSYEEQEAVAQEKPDLAARPGSSNHGWGVATDLCDGIQSFGTATHRWMQDNSMLYGWFHPGWAQQGGSKPEAWHWEFAG